MENSFQSDNSAEKCLFAGVCLGHTELSMHNVRAGLVTSMERAWGSNSG